MAKTKEKETHCPSQSEARAEAGTWIQKDLLWVIFTIVLLGWVFCARVFYNCRNFPGKSLKFETGLHFKTMQKHGMDPVLQDSLEIHFCTLWFPVLH